MTFLEVLKTSSNYIIEYVSKLETPQENSKGEKCYWAIKSHTTRKIISRHKTREEAEKHLKQIQYFKNK